MMALAGIPAFAWAVRSQSGGHPELRSLSYLLFRCLKRTQGLTG